MNMLYFYFNINMEEGFFRKREIAIRDDKKIMLEYKPIVEIFKFKTPPYIIVGVTTSGKTTLCMDILNKFSKECTNIYYVTATKENIADDTISVIPNCYKRAPTFDELSGIWKEITTAYEATNAEPSTLVSMLNKLCKKEESAAILQRLEEKQSQIQRERLQVYRSLRYPENDCIQYAKDDSKAFYIDTITKLILDFAVTRGTRSLTYPEMMTLNSFVSKAPKVLLLLDDITSELESLTKNKRRVNYANQMMQICEAYKALLIDILTRGRHYGALICMFLHSIDILKEKSYINNIIVLNDASAQKICNARTFPEDARGVIRAASKEVFNGSYPYHFIYLSMLTGEVCVSKADLHINEALELSDVNNRFVSVYNDINAGSSVEGKEMNFNVNASDESDGYDYDG